MDTILAGLFLTGSLIFPSSFLTWVVLLRRWILSKVVRIQVAACLTSILQAVMASVVGCYIVVNCHHDFLYARCWLVDVYMCFGLPYMLYDIEAMHAAYHTAVQSKTNTKITMMDTFLPFIKRKKLMVFHHLMVACVGFPVALFYRNGKGDFFIGCMFLTEVSTPFVNLRIILNKIGRNGSLLYRINDFMVLALFFLCRILVFPLVFWVYSWNREMSWYLVPARIPWHCTLSCAVIGGLQLMWYTMFTRSVIGRTGQSSRNYINNQDSDKRTAHTD